jgi:DNA-binding MarR family transcriptional regulator
MAKKVNGPVVAVDSSHSRPVSLPLDNSVGYQVRLTHRLIQRELQSRIAPYGVQLGMWYLLRVLWEEDGLTQRQLSQRIGIMEPTTLHTILAMERSGLVTRARNEADRRKINVFLTKRGRELQDVLIPVAVEVVNGVVRGFTEEDKQRFLQFLRAIQRNLGAAPEQAKAGSLDDFVLIPD